jgi:hypothetical protein
VESLSEWGAAGRGGGDAARGGEGYGFGDFRVHCVSGARRRDFGMVGTKVFAPVGAKFSPCAGRPDSWLVGILYRPIVRRV